MIAQQLAIVSSVLYPYSAAENTSINHIKNGKRKKKDGEELLAIWYKNGQKGLLPKIFSAAFVVAKLCKKSVGTFQQILRLPWRQFSESPQSVPSVTRQVDFPRGVDTFLSITLSYKIKKNVIQKRKPSLRSGKNLSIITALDPSFNHLLSSVFDFLYLLVFDSILSASFLESLAFWSNN